MSLLRLASKETKRIPLGEVGDYIEVLSDISKRTFSELVSSMPGDIGETGLTIAQAISFQAELFKTFVVGWSLDEQVDEATYQQLSRESADAIDGAVAKHFESLTPSSQEADKSEGPSPTDGRG